MFMSVIYNLDKRCLEILNIIMYTSGYLKIQDLADELQVSKRSVYYDISKINEWLESNNIDPLIQERGKGLLINKQQIHMKNLKNYVKNYISDYIDENVNRLAIWDIEDNVESDNQKLILDEIKK